MKTRLLASAFIISENDILLIKRSQTRKLAAGMWTGVGGHIEPHEINCPEEACLREIEEETGIIKNELTDLKLKYIIIRKRDNEIRLEYVFVSNTNKREVKQTEEGELHWVNQSEVKTLDMPESVRLTLEHYFAQGQFTHDLFVGTIDYSKDVPTVNWSIL